MSKKTFVIRNNISVDDYYMLESGHIPAYRLAPLLNKLSCWDTIEMFRLWNIDILVEVLGKRKFSEIN